jgi:hypothetical protein
VWYHSAMAYGDRVVQTSADGTVVKRSAKITRRGYTVTGQLAHTAAPAHVRQANIQKVESLKNKSTLTTLAGGRQIQQVAGKSAYVVNKGKGKPSGVKPAGTKLPPGQAKMARDAAAKKKK